MNKVTINDIAKRTGYSKSTISCALNGKDGVGEEKRKEIIKCAKEMGYTPNSFARSLSGRTYNTIGVILRDLTNPFYANVFCAIDKFCEERNYETIFYNLAGDSNRIITGLDLMKGKMVSGIILDFFGNDDHITEQIKQLGIPTVIFGFSIDKEISSVETNDENGAKKAVDYAVECGHKDIYYVTNKNNDIFNTRRSFAISQRMKELNLDFDNHVINVEPSTCAKTIIENCPKDSVLICYNDVLACAVISGLMKEKMYVPEHYSVIGFDNLSIIPYSLTSVDIPQYEMATQASKLLFEQIEERKIERIKLESQLIIRDSVKTLTK